MFWAQSTARGYIRKAKSIKTHEREGGGERERERERERETERERQRDRETERQRDRQTDRQNSKVVHYHMKKKWMKIKLESKCMCDTAVLWRKARGNPHLSAGKSSLHLPTQYEKCQQHHSPCFCFLLFRCSRSFRQRNELDTASAFGWGSNRSSTERRVSRGTASRRESLPSSVSETSCRSLLITRLRFYLWPFRCLQPISIPAIGRHRCWPVGWSNAEPLVQ